MQRKWQQTAWVASQSPPNSDCLDLVILRYIGEITPVPGGDLKKANYRIYRENDERGHSSSWKIKDDPVSPPASYIPIRMRKTLDDPRRQPGEQVQVWEDHMHGILAGDRPSCQSPECLGVAYATKSTGLSSDGQNQIRATITVCRCILIPKKGLSQPFSFKLCDPLLKQKWSVHSLETIGINPSQFPGSVVDKF